MKRFFQEWFNYQDNFLLTEDDSEKKKKIIICYIHSSIKILKTLTTFDFENKEKDIISFFLLKIEENKISKRLLENIGLSEKNIEDILLSFNISINNEIYTKSIFLLFLLLMKSNLFEDIKNIINQENQEEYSKIFQLKSYFKDFHSYDQKKANIDFILSPWKKKSKLYIYEELSSAEYVIEKIYFHGEKSCFINIDIINSSDGSKKTVSLDKEDNLYSLCKKVPYYLESNFLLESKFYEYFAFYISLCKNFHDFRTNFKNKDLLEIVKLNIDCMELKIQTEINKIFEINKINIIEYKGFVEKTQKLKKKLTRYLCFNNVDYYYILGSNDIIDNIQEIPKGVFEYYFHKEIVIHKKNLWIKTKYGFYDRVKLVRECDNLDWYWEQMKCMKNQEENIFLDGFLICPIQNLCKNGKDITNILIKHLIDYNVIDFQFQNEKYVFHFDFGLCSFYLFKDEFSVNEILNKYNFIMNREKDKVLDNVRNLPQRRKKSISFLINDRIEFKDECYFLNDNLIELNDLLEKIDTKLYNRNLNFRMILDIFNLEQNVEEIFKKFIYTTMHNKDWNQKELYFVLNKYRIQELDEDNTRYYDIQQNIINKMNKKNEIKKRKKKILDYLKDQDIIQGFHNNLNLNG